MLESGTSTSAVPLHHRAHIGRWWPSNGCARRASAGELCRSGYPEDVAAPVERPHGHVARLRLERDGSFEPVLGDGADSAELLRIRPSEYVPAGMCAVRHERKAASSDRARAPGFSR